MDTFCILGLLPFGAMIVSGASLFDAVSVVAIGNIPLCGMILVGAIFERIVK